MSIHFYNRKLFPWIYHSIDIRGSRRDPAKYDDCRCSIGESPGVGSADGEYFLDPVTSTSHKSRFNYRISLPCADWQRAYMTDRELWSFEAPCRSRRSNVSQ